MTDIIDFPGVTHLDIPADKVLQRAAEKELVSVVVIGETASGNEYFSSSIASGPEVLWMLERARLKLLQVVEQ